MATTYWRTDPKTGEMIGPLDEEELATNMWRTACKIRGLPLDTPYEIRSDFQRMSYSEQTCDHLWRNVYKKRGLIKTPSDDEMIENKKVFMEDLKKMLAEEEDLSPFEKMKIGKMMKKTQEELDELMNKDAPKKKIEHENPLMAMRRANELRMRNLTAEQVDEEAVKAYAAETAASTSF